MKFPRLNAVLPLAALLALACWLIFRPEPPGNSAKSTQEAKSPHSSQPGAQPNSAPLRTPAEYLASFFDRLRSEGLKAGDLDALRSILLAAPPDAAIAAILDFLASGRDALTGELFAIGENGELSGAPTFRVLLLDLLGRICREHERGEAVSQARTLLSRKSSADEWALALRNTAWLAPLEREFLTAKTREMLAHQPWRQQPTNGFREAFDIIVFLRDPAFIPDLAEMLRGEDADLQRSAGMALDRLAEMTPLEVMNFLNANPGELSDLPFLRADYYGKANLAQPAHRIAVETYLSRANVAQEEKEKFLASLASPGSFAADSLVTEPPSPDLPAAHEAGLRDTVDEWLRTRRFPALTAPLINLRAQIAQ